MHTINQTQWICQQHVTKFASLYTWSFQTSFHFDVEQKYFHQALDIFAQFFIHPLLRQDSVDREIQAVDSGKLSSALSWIVNQTNRWQKADMRQSVYNIIPDLSNFVGTQVEWKCWICLYIFLVICMFFAIKNVEYQMSLPSDDERACMLYGSLAKEGHPMGKFFTGNLMSVWPNTIDVCIVCDLWNILNILSNAYDNL